jgi:hypothetical protein
VTTLGAARQALRNASLSAYKCGGRDPRAAGADTASITD